METKKITKAPKSNKTVKPKTKGPAVDSYSAAGEKKGTVSLSEAIFGQKPNKVLLAQAVRVYLSNQRKAHAKTKTRGEIQASTKKVYRQKGTGGARHGARSAPIYVGGGIAHGPRGIENYSLVLPRAMRQRALISALSERAQAGTMLVCDLDKVEPKTGKVARVLTKVAGKNSMTIVFVDGSLGLAVRNIANVNSIPVNQLSAYHVLLGKTLVFTPDALTGLETRFTKN